MIHDGNYYSIVDKDKILSLMDDIEQNIVLFTTEISHDTILCSQDLWARILILQRKWRALSGVEDCHVRLSEGQYKYSTAVLSMGRIKRNIDNCKLSLHDP